MGRPIKKKFFLHAGNTPVDVIGGNGVSVSVNATGTGYSTGAIAKVSAPDNPDGVTATVNLTVVPAGGITSAVIANEGSGYKVAPTVTVIAPTTQSATANATSASFTLTNVSGVNGIYPGMLISGFSGLAAYSHVSGVTTNTITMDKAVTSGSTTSNAFSFSDTGSGVTFTVGLVFPPLDTGTLAVTAYLTTGTSAVSSAIIKQESSRRYLVENAQGYGKCKLVTTDTLTTGTMKLIATDFGGATYWVKKLTAHRATLVNRTSTSTSLVIKESTGWTLGAATGTTVTIASN